MATTPFPTDPVLVGIISAYVNGALIADKVLPRLEPRLTKEEFKWWEFDFGQLITLQDTKVGRKSEPNTVEFNATEKTSSTEDFALDDIIPNSDVSNAPAGHDPIGFAAQALMDLILLDREVRVAQTVFNPALYPEGNTEVLAGTSKWADPASKPITAVAEAADAMVMRPNNMAIGRSAWTALRTNSSILSAIKASGQGDGYASKRAVADLLELDDIHIGESWVNSAKPGQPVQRIRTWGNHALLYHSAPIASSMHPRPTFGWTAQFGDRIGGQLPEPKVGARGSVRVRAGESVKEVISAPELGHLFQDVI